MLSSASSVASRLAGAAYVAARRAPVRAASCNGAQRWSHVEAKLKEMGIELPEAGAALGSYVATVRTGNLVFTAGHLPFKDGSVIRGRVGQDTSVEEGAAAAQQCTINLLASLKAELGDLDKIVRVVKVTGFVSCVSGFSGQPKVVNGASDLIKEAFGEAGVHARSAVGVSALPLNVPVEVEAVVEFRE